jgi:APA family basic amino acid/polyamine antiporter
MRAALGPVGATIIAAGIAISTVGFLGQALLTAPRVYFAMARDGVFFRRVAWLHPRTHVPVVAIVLQGTIATAIALSGRYDQILRYVVSIDFLFFGVTAAALFVFRRRDLHDAAPVGFRAPGHPITTGTFVLAAWLIVANTVYRYPTDTAAGIGILAAGVPIFLLWRRRK